MWQVYILECGNGSLYTGITNNLPKRLVSHASGKGAVYTRTHLPIKLVYSEVHPSKSSALKREAQIKRLSRLQKASLFLGNSRGKIGLT